MLKELLSPWGWTEACLHVNVKWLFNLDMFWKVLVRHLCINNNSFYTLYLFYVNQQRKGGTLHMFALL